MTIPQATTLKRIVDRTRTTQRNIGNAERVVLGALENMGCIELDEKAGCRVSSDLAAALPDLR